MSVSVGAFLDGQAALFEPPEPPVRRAPDRSDGIRALTAWLPYVRGIGPHLSARLRAVGVDDWRGLDAPGAPLPRQLRAHAAWASRRGKQALQARDAGHFLAALPRPEHWRVAVAFPEHALFLDIETTGLSSHYHRVTCVGWALGGDCGVLVLDGDETALDNGGDALAEALARASVLVTFNGAHFDVPFLRRRLPVLAMPTAHVDLRHTGRRAGLTGGQKKVEEELGLRRADLAGMTGEDAPALWFRYQRGDMAALETLLRYNHADVDGLRRILGSVASRRVPGFAELPAAAACCSFASPLAMTSATGGGTGPAGAGRALRAPLTRAYRGHVGPRVVLRDLPEARGLRVVGIDLAGSARGRTGWALVEGGESETVPLRTDEEILSRTLAARPRLVSIDAPLSLPAGRVSVGDDDPGRQKYGIMRECEREMKRRGVNSYPALIQSMQGLTARGIEFARTLRGLGVPVIESFPGAMQDILGIPRKGLSLEMLKQAVAEYGLAGPWQDGPATHDEIDALSSAIVAQMFWAGRYEALGTDEEDHLIVPDVDRRKTRVRVVGLSGPTGSGKSTAAALLADRGFASAGFSAALADVRTGLPRAELQRLGEAVRTRPDGQRRLGQKVIRNVGDAPLAVVDGLRFPEDDALMRETYGPAFVHVHLDCLHGDRRTRFLARGGDPDEYAAAAASPTEQGAAAMRALADQVVDTTGRPDASAAALLRAVGFPDDLPGTA